MDFAAYSVLTFDCYGTLIDWESGIRKALRPFLDAHGVALDDAELLEQYARFEEQIEAGPYRKYRDVLRGVVRNFGEQFGFTPSPAEADALPNSLSDWPPFPDTVAALRTLKQRYRLAILSNTDDDLFPETAKRLQVPFDYVITAEQVGSYKPSHRNFEAALARIGLPKEQILHVAQSLYHDIAPAKALGIANVWINRRHAVHGFGATVPAEATPDLELPDLRSLAALAAGA
jgi:2-haloacid dehalogenase